MEKNQKQTSLQLIKADAKNLGIAVLAYLLYWGAMELLFGVSCPMKILFGIPCAGCGMSRALIYVLTFRFRKAWQMQPMLYLWMLWGVLLLIDRYVVRKYRKTLSQVLILVALVSFGFYLCKMFTVYPGEEPYTYFSNNLIEWIRRMAGEVKSI